MLSIASRIINDLKSKHPGYLINLVFNNPKVIYKYFRRISSNKWIKDYFDDDSEYLSLYKEINEWDQLSVTKDKLKDAFSNINGRTSRGNLYIDGVMKNLHALNIYTLIRKKRPEIVIETGVCNGFSTNIILKALNVNGEGRLYSIDYPEFTDNRQYESKFWNGKGGAVVPSGKTSGWLVSEDLENRWTLLIGKSEDLLENLLKDLNLIDIFIHDSEHSYHNQLFEFSTAYKHLRQDGLLICSDINFNNAFDDFWKSVRSSSKRYFIDYSLSIIEKNQRTL